MFNRHLMCDPEYRITVLDHLRALAAAAKLDSGAGPAGVRSKHLHAASPAVRTALAAQDQAMLNSPEEIPWALLLAILTLLPKKEGASAPTEMRGIRSFEPRFRQLITMEHAVRQKAMRAAGTPYEDEGNVAYQPNRDGCASAALLIRVTMLHARVHGRALALGSNDQKKCFDTFLQGVQLLLLRVLHHPPPVPYRTTTDGEARHAGMAHVPPTTRAGAFHAEVNWRSAMRVRLARMRSIVGPIILITRGAAGPCVRLRRRQHVRRGLRPVREKAAPTGCGVPLSHAGRCECTRAPRPSTSCPPLLRRQPRHHRRHV